jgi:hypothetical protein
VDYIKTVNELSDFVKAETVLKATANTSTNKQTPWPEFASEPSIFYKINVLGKHEIMWRSMLVLCCQCEHTSSNVKFNSGKDEDKLSNTTASIA